MKVFVIASLLLLASSAWAAPSVQDNRVDSENGGTFSRVAKYLGACFESDDLTTCLAVKGITALNRAARSNNIELVNGVSFKRDAASAPSTARSAKALSENEIYAQLPEAAEERNSRLVDMAMETTVDFLSSHNLEVKLPAEATQEMARALDEGRGKLKKLAGPLLLAIGAKLLTVIPLVLGGLALLTAKAVFVAKIAFLLALVAGGSRLFGGLGNKFGSSLGGGYSSNGWNGGQSGGWTSAASSAYPYARSMNGDGSDGSSSAQELAYGAQVSAQ